MRKTLLCSLLLAAPVFSYALGNVPVQWDSWAYVASTGGTKTIVFRTYDQGRAKKMTEVANGTIKSTTDADGDVWYEVRANVKESDTPRKK